MNQEQHIRPKQATATSETLVGAHEHGSAMAIEQQNGMRRWSGSSWRKGPQGVESRGWGTRGFEGNPVSWN